MKIAVVHLRHKMLTRKYNPEKTLNILTEARRRGASLAVVSPLLSIEDILENYPRSRIKSVLKSYSTRLPGSAVKPVIESAIFNGLIVITPGLLERAGPKLFSSSIMIRPTGVVSSKDRYRRITITKMEAEVGISAGKEITVFNIGEIRIGILMDEDILIPEIARYLSENRVDTLIYCVKKRSLSEPSKIRRLASSRALENNVPIIVAGGMVERHGELLYTVPSLLVNEKGEVVGEAFEDEDIILIPLTLKRNTTSTTTRQFSPESYKIFSKICKDLSKMYKGRTELQ